MEKPNTQKSIKIIFIIIAVILGIELIYVTVLLKNKKNKQNLPKTNIEQSQTGEFDKTKDIKQQVKPDNKTIDEETKKIGEEKQDTDQPAQKKDTDPRTRPLPKIDIP